MLIDFNNVNWIDVNDLLPRDDEYILVASWDNPLQMYLIETAHFHDGSFFSEKDKTEISQVKYWTKHPTFKEALQ